MYKNIATHTLHITVTCSNLKQWTMIHIYDLRIITGNEMKLTHWGWVTHTCAGNLTIIVSDNGLSTGRRQAIIWTNAGISLIGPLGTNFSEMLIKIQAFSFKKMRLKVSSAKWRSFVSTLMCWIFSQSSKDGKNGKPWTHHPIYCIQDYWQNELKVTFTLNRTPGKHLYVQSFQISQQNDGNVQTFKYDLQATM